MSGNLQIVDNKLYQAEISAIFDNNKDVKEANEMGITDLSKKYELNEIIKGDSIFCATGITTNEVTEGIDIKGDSYVSETLITHKNSNIKEIMKKTYPI